MAVSLTNRTIDALITRSKREHRALFLYDTRTKGFGCKATPTGHVAWFVQQWIGGRGGTSKRHVFGSYPALKPDDARTEAEKLIGDTQRGVDLPSRKKQAREAKRAAHRDMRLSEAVGKYLALHDCSKPGTYWYEVKRRFDKDVVPALGKDCVVRDITRSDVEEIVEAKEAQGFRGSARYTFAVLRPFFKWCVAKGPKIPASPLADAEAPKPLKPRDRVLSEYEIEALWRAAVAESWPFGPFYQMLLLTAQRRDEVAAMRRNEINRDKAIWTIPAERTKNSKEHVVHLSPQALRVLDSLPKLDSEFVFTTTLTTKITGYGRAKDRLDAQMQIELREVAPEATFKPFRLHDLRRTAASGMAALGFLPHVIERVLNHVSGAQGGLVGVYQRHEYLEERKQALAAWANYVEKLCAQPARSEEPSNVIPMRA